MKKKLICIALAAAMCASIFTGCGKKKAQTQEKKILTPDDMEPDYYTDEENIPSGTYCIAHKAGKNKKDMTVRYYPLYQADSFGKPDNGATGPDGSRYFWLNYNKDEGKLPTMYPGDRIVYKSDQNIPDSYTIEKFFDEGYTIGVGGIYESDIGKPAINLEEDGCYICKTSDARILRKMKTKDSDSEKSEIIFNAINGKELKMDNIDAAGMVSGLKEGKTYEFDLRLGTQSYPTKLKANIHEFMLGETYKYKSFDYVTDTMIRVNLPDYLTTGYYEINGAGAFRFLKTETSYKDLTARDYNDFIYTYSGNYPTGTQDGKVLDDDGYLVDYEEYINQMAEDDAEKYRENDTGDYDSDYDSDDVEEDEDTDSGRTTTPEEAGGSQADAPLKQETQTKTQTTGNGDTSENTDSQEDGGKETK